MKHVADDVKGAGYEYLHNKFTVPLNEALRSGHNRGIKTAAKPNKKAPLGQGGRFAAVEASAAKSGAANPAAVAAAAGRKKYGKAQFQKLAAKGK